ncbi:hypothetical protein [Vreelandella subglaciescola]|uniref:Uncharacterized protein n=1 Tax=Vreelandella subglaciescola TaxID=29571 RepID=A0A1M7F5A1_9GAMM|nr:hypothetical protein [Halomonas subglaciescola]SHL99206.1 hypothetical protein SAMN05878437_0664 [Halomonas subglaciescola]
MLNRFWIPTLAATALLLSACGDSDAPTETPADEAPAEQSSQPTESGPQDEGNADAPAPDASLNGPSENATAGNAGPSEEGPGDIEADDETLSVDPQDVLNNEDAAMPGEVTTSDVDKVISDIDKRFEEAEKKMQEQFDEVKDQAPTTEPLPGESGTSAEMDVELPESDLSTDEPSADELMESSVSNAQKLDGELGKSEVDALIEDAERRFEETQKRLQEQFEALEQEGVKTAPDTLQPMPESGDTGQNDGQDDAGSE